MAIQVIPVPDIGGAEDVDVIEICFAPGDRVSAEQSLIVLETDKASMDIPSPVMGKVVSLKISEGDKVSEGDAIIEIEVDAGADASSEQSSAATEPAGNAVSATKLNGSGQTDASADTATTEATETKAGASSEIEIPVPDIGGAEGVDVIEVCVAPGDDVGEGDSLIVLETDKASMEVPSPAAGKILTLAIAEGDKVSEGDVILTLLQSGASAAGAAGSKAAGASKQADSSAPAPVSAPPASAASTSSSAASVPANTENAIAQADSYAGPAVRKLARQLGVSLSAVKPSGPRSRYLKDDIRAYVKKLIAEKDKPGVSGGSGIPAIPAVDFAQFGEIELVKMSKIKKVTATNMSRNWLNVPHVTQFDEADITDLEAFRKEMKGEAEKRGVKLTPLPFLLKACACALRYESTFNVSIHPDGEHIVQKNYVHIGVAVATPAGLMVPVIRDVDKKGLWELAAESAVMAKKARDGKLLPRDMQGACFTISSLGAMGGTGFTPIVNAPEVAILGVSKGQIKPVWNGSEFIPRQMLPLAVSYDHRAINGADAGRFFTYLVSVLGDIRQLLL